MATPVGVDQVMYCQREDVKRALDVMETSRTNRQIDRAIIGSSRSIEGAALRNFFPLVKTVILDWPNLPSTNSAYPWRLWLNTQHTEVISLTSFTSGGAVIPAAGYLLEPVNDGPPYTHLDVNLGTSYALSSATTWQQSQVLTGVFGGSPATTGPGGALAAALSDTTGTAVQTTDSANVGVGSILVVDSERMMVTERKMVTTAVTLGADMTASVAAVTVAVADGTKFDIDEILLIDAERMLIVDIAGNNLLVKRSWDGSVIATHTTGATIYALRQLTVIRGALGTTAATHLISAPILVHLVPGLIRNWGIAEAINNLEQEQAGYARTVGSGDNTRNASGAGLADIRRQAMTAHGRQVRTLSI